MAKVELKLKGLQALQQRLLQQKQALEARLEMELLAIAEDAVTYSKEHKGYKDRTGNLKNTISFALFKDGQPVSLHIGINKAPKGERVVTENFVQSRIDELAREKGIASTKGYSLIIVAPMEYARAVEDKGYNVLYLTNFYLQDKLKELMADIFTY